MSGRRTITHELLGVGALALIFSLATLSGCDKGAEAGGEGEAKAEAEVRAEAKVDGDADAKVEGEAEGEAVAAVVAEARVAGDVTIKPADFELEVVADLIKEGEIESAAELEVLINDEARGINHVDIDADGTIDHIQVVEVRGPTVDVEVDAAAAVDVDLEVDAEVEGVAEAAAVAAAEVKAEAAVIADADVVFELRAIPSSSAKAEAAVSFASAGFVAHEADAEVEIRAGFHAVVPQPEVTVITHRVPVSFEANVIVGGGAFFTWVYAPARVTYVGTYEVDTDGRWIPPGHVKHGHWKATGDGPPGHAKVHGSAKAKGKHSGGGVFDVKVGKSKSKGKVGGSLKGGFGGSAKAGASASAKGGKSGKSGGGKSSSGKSSAGKSKGGKGKKK
ncbi:MAG: hypothetical protein KC486_26415 [Myxococcales bacterium]|nr:hypothetical protein [Myxococcales bacterium]